MEWIRKKNKLESNNILARGDGGGLMKKGDKYFLYSNESANDLAEIPKDLAQLVRVGLKANDRILRDKNELSRDIFFETNCHKTAVFLEKKPKIKEGDTDKWCSKEFEYFDNEGVEYKNFHEFEKYILEQIGEELAYVKVRVMVEGSISDTGEVKLWDAHSFYAKKTKKGKVVLFEKKGFREHLFDVVSLKNLYKRYSKKIDGVFYKVVAFKYNELEGRLKEC